MEKFSDLGDTLAYFLVSSINHEAHTLEFKSRLDERTRSLGFGTFLLRAIMLNSKDGRTLTSDS